MVSLGNKYLKPYVLYLLSIRQSSMATLEAWLAEVFSSALHSILKCLSLTFTTNLFDIAKILRCNKKCLIFSSFFDGNYPVGNSDNYL